MDGKQTLRRIAAVKVIILAAGRGSRMGLGTSERPKCLTTFRGKPLIEWTLDNLASVPREDIFLIVGYKAPALEYLGIKSIENKNWSSTNIVGSLRVAKDLLVNSDCLILYSDVFTEPSSIDCILASNGPSVLSVINWREIWSRRFIDPLDDLETFKYDQETMHLIEIGSRSTSLDDIQGQFGGIFRMTPEVWIKLEGLNVDLDSLDVTSLIQKCLTLGIVFEVANYEGEWVEIDSLSDLEFLE